MSKSPREVTNTIIDLMNEGTLDPKQVAEMCLSWLAEADVVEMVRANDLQGLILGEEDDEPEVEDDEQGNYLWLEYDHDDA